MIGKSNVLINLEKLSIKFGELSIINNGKLSLNYNETEVVIRKMTILISTLVFLKVQKNLPYILWILQKYIEINSDYRS